MLSCAKLERDLPSLAAKVGEEDGLWEDPGLEPFRQSLLCREQLCHQWGRTITAHEIQEIEFQCWDSVGNRYAYSEQNSTVGKYYEEFCEWKRWLNIVCGWEDPEEVVVGIFIRGLKEPIRKKMSSSFPASLNRAYWEAIAIELSWEKQCDGADLDQEMQKMSAALEEKNQMDKSKFGKLDYNLGESVDKVALRDVFQSYGNISPCEVVKSKDGTSKGYGFVKFKSDELDVAHYVPFDPGVDKEQNEDVEDQYNTISDVNSDKEVNSAPPITASIVTDGVKVIVGSEVLRIDLILVHENNDDMIYDPGGINTYKQAHSFLIGIPMYLLDDFTKCMSDLLRIERDSELEFTQEEWDDAPAPDKFTDSSKPIDFLVSHGQAQQELCDTICYLNEINTLFGLSEMHLVLLRVEGFVNNLGRQGLPGISHLALSTIVSCSEGVRVYAWKGGTCERLGRRGESDKFSPVREAIEKDGIRVVGITTGAYHSLALADDESMMDAVVKVFCMHTKPNFLLSWQRRQYSSSSSGFVIKGRRVLTNAYSVEHYTRVKLKKHGSDVKYLETVLATDTKCNIAMLTVKNDEFWDGVPPLDFGNLPALQDSLTIVGYLIDGDNISVTSGILSRIEILSYVLGSIEILGLHIDVVMNSGIYGGPTFTDKGSCVGIAFQSLKHEDAENKMKNHDLRISMGMGSDQKGVRIRRIDPKICSLRAHFSNRTNQRSVDGNSLLMNPEKDEKYVMEAAHAEQELYKRVTVEEFVKRRHSWDFWVTENDIDNNVNERRFFRINLETRFSEGERIVMNQKGNTSALRFGLKKRSV